MNLNPRLSTDEKTRSWIFIGILLILALTLASAASPLAADDDLIFFSIDGALASGESIDPVVPIFVPERNFNFMLTVSGGGPVSLIILDSNDQPVWIGSVNDGESVWGTGTLTAGQNAMYLTNTGGSASNFALTLYDLPNAPFDWAGFVTPTGMASEIRVIFPEDGLYTFNLGVGGGQYQLLLDEDYIQKTAVSNSTVSYFVPAGAHLLKIIHDDIVGADWSINISSVGAAADSLPFNKSGEGLLGSGNFVEEWLPVNLASASQVNLELTLSGAAGETLALELVQPNRQVVNLPLNDVFAGETVWATVDMPAGVSLLHLVADSGNVNSMAYDLTLDMLPSPQFSWTGSANAAGLHSESRVVFPESGLYNFAFGLANGRYQFQINDNFLLKTVEGADSVNYFIPAGTHTLILNQDSGAGAEDWQVSITQGTATPDSLPYAKIGGNLGGSANDFREEWLPITLDTGQTVNLELLVDGSSIDSFSLEIYGATGITPTYTLENFLGSETVWTNFPLAAGLNRIHLVADEANASSLAYDLEVTAVPADGTASWGGFALDSGNHSSIMVNFTQSGLYRFEILNESGFANLVLDDNITALRAPLSIGSSYDIQVSAGMHEIFTVQDANYPATDWLATVTPIDLADSFFTFSGSLAAGDSVTPIYSASSAMDFNFAWTVTGADAVSLIITDESNAVVWQGAAKDGETLWGTGTLLQGTNSLTLENAGSSAADIELTLYHLPTAPYSWAGMANPVGLNSEIRMIFPTDGLYTFDYDVNNGELYQLLVNDEFIQKTIPISGTVTYFVPAGTHNLTIDQESGRGMVDWALDVSAVGAAADTLPYQKMGGPLGNSDFYTEWLPINLVEDTAVNVAVSVAGTAGDHLTFGSNGFAVDVFAGETYWASLDLLGGTNLLSLVADGGNSDSLDYELWVYALPELPYSWDGLATAATGPNRYSTVHVPFPVDGLYTFDFGLDNGRYQFHLNDDYFQKVVEGETSVTIFVPAGEHELRIDHDSAAGADWDVMITAAGPTPDELPFTKIGGGLGSRSTEFTTDILPLYTGAATEVNVSLSVTGNVADGLALTIDDLETGANLLALNPVLGAEAQWATFSLPASGASFTIEAPAGNIGPLTYELVVDVLPQITGVSQNSVRWDGVAAANGLNPTMRLHTPISGLYLVEVDMPLNGFIAFSVDEVLARLGIRSPLGFFYDFEVPLMAGIHTFQGEQNSAPLTTWTLTTTLLTADAPHITAVSPYTIPVGIATTINLTGSNFMPGATVALHQNGNVIPLQNVVIGDAITATATVPATVALGEYDVVLTNPDNQTATYANGVQVYQPNYHLYLPVVRKP